MRPVNRSVLEPGNMANIEELKSNGLKATLPRLKILDVFQRGALRHMTAEDVYRVLLDERSDIGLATVYRVLTQFEQAGILSRSSLLKRCVGAGSPSAAARARQSKAARCCGAGLCVAVGAGAR